MLIYSTSANAQLLGFISGNVQFVLGIELVDDTQRAIAVANVFVDVTL